MITMCTIEHTFSMYTMTRRYKTIDQNQGQWGYNKFDE